MEMTSSFNVNFCLAGLRCGNAEQVSKCNALPANDLVAPESSACNPLKAAAAGQSIQLYRRSSKQMGRGSKPCAAHCVVLQSPMER